MTEDMGFDGSQEDRTMKSTVGAQDEQRTAGLTALCSCSWVHQVVDARTAAAGNVWQRTVDVEEECESL